MKINKYVLLTFFTLNHIFAPTIHSQPIQESNNNNNDTLDLTKIDPKKSILVNIFTEPEPNDFHAHSYYFDYLEATSEEQTLFSYLRLLKAKKKNIDRDHTNMDFRIDSESFMIGSRNQGLLNSAVNSDQAFYGQTIILLPLDLKIPASNHWGILEFNFTPCLNRLWGNFENEGVSFSNTRLGNYLTETQHSHEGNLSPLFVRESWLKIYSQTDRSYFKIGAFPRKIGLGLILGNLYRVTGTILTSSSERSVDQYRPGIELHTCVGKKNKHSVNLYYSMYDNQALSLDNQIRYTESQSLGNSGNGPRYERGIPTRPLMQVSQLFLAQSNIIIDCGKELQNKILIQPFFLLNSDKNQSTEFPSDASTNLITIGSAFKVNTPRANGFIDIGFNLGSQSVMAWDRNGTIDVAFDYVLEKLDPSDPYFTALELPNPDISINYGNGKDFAQQNPFDPTQIVHFKNAYNRFRNPYKNFFRGFMIAADIGYEYNPEIKLGFITGYASGDNYPNDTQEKTLLYRLRPDWKTVSSDYCKNYHGFYSVQPIYTGINVRSLQLLRSLKFNRPLQGPRDVTSNLFSNVVYAGMGFWYKKNFKKGILLSNTNIIPMSLTHSLKYGFDPVFNDIKNTFNYDQDAETTLRFLHHNKTLSKYLGTEFNTTLEFFTKNDLVFYCILTFFVPGSYYHDIKKYSYLCKGKELPLTAQSHSLSDDRAGYINLQKYRITLLDETAIYGIAGVKFLFATDNINYNKK